MYIEIITNKNTYKRIEELMCGVGNLDNDVVLKLQALKEFTKPFSKVLVNYDLLYLLGKGNFYTKRDSYWN